MLCSMSGTRNSAISTSTVSCPRCGLCRPEPNGAQVRCRCCGLVYEIYDPVGPIRQAGGGVAPVPTGSTPATGANPAPDRGEDPLSLTAERLLWGW